MNYSNLAAKLTTNIKAKEQELAILIACKALVAIAGCLLALSI